MEAGYGFNFPNMEWLFFEELQRSLEIPSVPECNNLESDYYYDPSFFHPTKYINSFEADFHLWNEYECPSLFTEDPQTPTNLFFNQDHFFISPSNNNCDQTLNAVVEEGIKKRFKLEETLITESYDHVNSNSNSNNPNKNEKMSKMEGLKYEEIRKYFEMPISKAAKEMNVGLTVLKKRCRELNIKRWPHRKIKSLKALISNVKEMGMSEVAEVLEEQRKKLQVLPEMELTAQTKRLRQACFKANYKKRRALAFFQTSSY